MKIYHFLLTLSFFAPSSPTNPPTTPTASTPSQSSEINYKSYLTGVPYFDTTLPTNITAQVGSNAFLPCKVKQLGNKSVSWIRSRDSHILTVDRYTFISDQRFQVIHYNYDNWNLQIRYVQQRDEGTYECQITTEPKKSRLVRLNVMVPQIKILGGDDIFVKSGSSVIIKCVIMNSFEPPSYIFWYHNDEMVLSSSENSESYQTVEKLAPDTTLGMLTIRQTSKINSGNYTCAPSNAKSTSVILHVLNGEHPAAMQQESTSSASLDLHETLNMLVLPMLLILF